MAKKLSQWTAAIRHRAELLVNVVRRRVGDSTHGRLIPDDQAMRGRYFGLLVHMDRSDR
jgi:hypothetical protein